jgi:hypothetical protein
MSKNTNKLLSHEDKQYKESKIEPWSNKWLGTPMEGFSKKETFLLWERMGVQPGKNLGKNIADKVQSKYKGLK